MKQIINILVLLVLANIALAQAPQGIPYQAAARNSSGAILASTAISVRFTIRDSIATGAIKYRETHNVTTSEHGMFDVIVGKGSLVTGTFSDINWGTNAKFMQVEMDPAGGISYINMGTTQMMSVPYALVSATASSVSLTVSATGDTLYSGGGKYVIIPGISAANCMLPGAGTIAGTASVCVGSTTTLSNAITGGVWNSSATGVATVGSTGVVTGVAAGTATVSYTVTNSCGSTVTTRVITVNALPSAGTIAGAATVCASSTTAFSNATSGGVWSSSAAGVATVSSTGVVAGVAAGTATIRYTVTNGCGSAVATRVVTVTAPASAGTITGTATITVGSTTTLSNATTGGAWSSGATAIATVSSTGVVTGIAAGSATISYVATNGCGSAVTTRVVTVSATSLTVGSTFGGGVIAYILQPGDPGYIAGEPHGLIAAPSDQSTGIQWGCWGTSVGGTSTAFGTGAANTALVSATCGAGTAARLCADLVLNGYSDWYLPSLDELQKMFYNKSAIGGFSLGDYWSSSEDSHSPAVWVVYFEGGYTCTYHKGYIDHVRAVRTF